MTTETTPFSLARFGGLLRRGKHDPDGMACVMEARSVYLSLDWSDHPAGTTPMAKARGVWSRRINDARWSSDEARTAALWPTVTMDDPAPGWPARLAKRTIEVIVPMAMRAAAERLPAHADALRAAADRCEREGTRESAIAARDVARSAAYAAAAAADADAYAAATDAARDDVLNAAVRIALEVWTT